MGATFDPEMIKAVGRGIASETRSLGIHEILAPNLDLARSLVGDAWKRRSAKTLIFLLKWPMPS